MGDYQATVKMGDDGAITLRNLPYPPGMRLEITIHAPEWETTPRSGPPPPHPNRNTVIRYDRPFDPALIDDCGQARN